MAQVHVSQRLTDISVRFPEEQKTVRDLFFPKKTIPHLTDQFAQWNRGNILRIEDADLATGDEELPTVIDLVLDSDISIQCGIIGARIRAKEISSRNADPSLDWETERAIALKQRQANLLEYRALKGVLRNSTIMGSSFVNVPAANQFDGTGTGVAPVSYLRSYVLGIKSQTGGNAPNVGAMSSFVLSAIAASEEFKDRSKYTRLVVADEDSEDGQLRILESLIGMPPKSLHTTDAIYNSAKAGLAESPKQFIGSSVILAYVAPPSIRTYGFGARFIWNGYSQDEMAIIKVPQYDGGLIPGEEMRAFSVVQYKPINLVAGVTLDQCVNVASATYQNLLD